MNKNVQLVFEDSNEMDVVYGTTVREVLNELNDDEIIALRINGSAVPADYEIVEDAFVNYIYVSDRIGKKIYMKGLEYVYINAVKEVFGKKTVVNIKHSLDKGLYTELITKKKFDKTSVDAVRKKMKEICERDIEFNRINVSREDAFEYVTNNEEHEKALKYTYMTNDSVTMYELDGEYNYFYYIMPSSTRFLKRFELTYLAPNGIVLSYPIDHVVPKYNPRPLVL